MHVRYSICELILFGTTPVLVRLVFIGFFNTSETKSWATATSVIALVGAAEGLGLAIVQSKFPPFAAHGFPLKQWYLLMAFGSMFAWIFILGPSLGLMTALSSLNLIDNSKTMMLIAGSGALFGGVIGAAQYFVHRRMYSNSSILILSKSSEWMLLTAVCSGVLLLLRIPVTPLGAMFAIFNACVVSGAIQVFFRNVTFDLLNPIEAKKLT